ncbi:hypothetical protein VNI00_012604 [Paramarasmius palmivorus]|uniref:Uncharacterized protein n=1 Tax=Paramarasmius palmivorus TaxID=297713 RepID=A0AAW0C608_9AGAR
MGLLFDVGLDLNTRVSYSLYLRQLAMQSVWSKVSLDFWFFKFAVFGPNGDLSYHIFHSRTNDVNLVVLPLTTTARFQVSSEHCRFWLDNEGFPVLVSRRQPESPEQVVEHTMNGCMRQEEHRGSKYTSFVNPRYPGTLNLALGQRHSERKGRKNRDFIFLALHVFVSATSHPKG